VKPRRQARSVSAQARWDFPTPGRSGEDEVVALGEPGTGSQAQELLAVEAPGCAEVDVFDAVRVAHLRRSQTPRELAILARGVLGIDEQPQAFGEGEFVERAGGELLVEGLDHGVELHGVHLLDRLLGEHQVSSDSLR
jgi:hypothetical protein